MLNYHCKKCGYGFSQADKAWDQAVIKKACSKCNNPFDDFYVSSEATTEVIEKYEAGSKVRLKELEQFKIFTFILCSLFFLFMLFTGQLLELAAEPKGFKIILLGVAGLFFGFNSFRKLFTKD